MKQFFLRDIVSIWRERQKIFLPFLFFLVSFLLLGILDSAPSSKHLPIFQVLMVLSTVGFIGRYMHSDLDSGIMNIILDHQPSLMPFLIAKLLTLSIILTCLYGGAWSVLNFVAFGQEAMVKGHTGLICVMLLAINLSLLILLIEGLLFKVQYISFLGVLVLIPFVMPLLLLSTLICSWDHAEYSIKGLFFLLCYTVAFVTLGINALAFLLKGERFS